MKSHEYHAIRNVILTARAVAQMMSESKDKEYWRKVTASCRIAEDYIEAQPISKSLSVTHTETGHDNDQN